MRRPEFIARQSRCPTGLLGLLISRVMAKETAAANEQLLSMVEFRPTDHVLEIGFGHGRTIELAAAAVPQGFVAGVDLSEDMVRGAAKRLRLLIEAQRAEVQRADSAHLPYDERRFDRAYALHTLYFWSNPAQHFREVYRVLKPGGRFVLGFMAGDDPQARANFPATVYHFYSTDQVRGFLEEAGFGDSTMLRRDISSHPIVFAVAHRR
ncbi:MAG: class I SAM-dependent methyltransferase [bacterium]